MPRNQKLTKVIAGRTIKAATTEPGGVLILLDMSNDPEGRATIKGLDGKEFGGRSLVVNEARPQEDRPHDSWTHPRR